MTIRTANASRSLVLVLSALFAAVTASAHPGSGIVVDRQGQVYFIDTGAGVWKIDLQGRLVRHRGQAYHWMAIDHRGVLTGRDMPRDSGGELPVVGPDPTLILSSDFPVAVGRDGTFFYPQPAGDSVKLMRLRPGGRPSAFVTLPPVVEVDPDGKAKPVPWIHGLAASEDGSLYYAEQAAVRKVAADGTVSLVAGKVEVPGCEPPPAVEGERHLGPGLRGLAVTRDGTVYVAASACSALLKITPGGVVSVVLRGTDAWSPTGVAVSGPDLYVLEYRHIKAERREAWLPRVRKLTSDGRATVIAAVERR